MELIDVTPIMTSDTTPVPYVVSASSVFNYNYPAWNAFDNKVSMASNDGWVSSSTGSKWIKIDFSKPTYISAYKIITRGATGDTNLPKSWVLDGSNDDAIWENIDVRTSEFQNYTPLQEKIFECKKVAYRYYRINISESHNNSYVCIGQLRFLCDNEPIKEVSHSYAFHAQTLPMNTTLNILNKTNDNREGLLGMANDNDNYGSLYVVGKDGKSHLTRSGIKKEVIFEGKANELGKYSLLSSINNFKQIIVYADALSTSDNYYHEISTTIDVDSIEFLTNHARYTLLYPVNSNSSTTTSTRLAICFNDSKTFEIAYKQIGDSTYKSIQIIKIVGIY